MKQSILIVEDDERLRSFLLSSLEKAGYEALTAASAHAAVNILREAYVSLVLLDLRLGESSGLDILKTIRRQDDFLPVIIVSSCEDQETKIDGFDIGCDDYITKPFYIHELLLRIRRILRRSRVRPAESRLADERLQSGPFEIDIASLVVKKNEVGIEMRKKLFDLFLYFVRNPCRVVPIATLREIGGDSVSDMSENSLYVHIRQLRTLIEDDPSKPRYLKTVRNVGYLYTTDDDFDASCAEG